MRKEVLIIGAGKIGRGFIAHLFFRSGYKIWFLDASKDVVQLLNKEKKYRVDIAGAGEDMTEYVELAGAFTLEDSDKVAALLSRIDLMASSVGAGNMERVARFIKHLLINTGRENYLNWIICENANRPAKKIRDILLENADHNFRDFVASKIGLIETQVLRTGMPANAAVIIHEPLALRMYNWWTLPLDKDAFIGPIPDVEGFDPKPNFSNELVRKLYTFNGTNGPIAYIGWANGYRILHEAALAYPDFFHQVQEEAAFGLIHEFRIDANEQRKFMALAMQKYTDSTLNDQVERNANDSRRKVSKEDRLMGPALLCLKHGKMPYAYARSIAAAYYYNGSSDEGTRQVQQTVHHSGIETAIKKYSSIDESCPMFDLIVSSFNRRDFIF